MEYQAISLKRSAQLLESLIDFPFSNQSSIYERPKNLTFLINSEGRTYNSSLTKSPVQKTVMICDDESDVLRAYKIALSSRYSVLTASSGEECLNKYNNELKSGAKIDVLVLDYKLGDMLGDEVACKIRDLDGTKIILISAFEISNSFLNDLTKRNCITTFVKKPITMASLLATVERTLLE
jgi:response regulator RpfG family c-di-GMP phosphodiesterase